MSALIQMRQRIRAIETIKKITHAMRLISMSSHSHLKNRQGTLARYVAHLETLLSHVQHYCPEWQDPVLHPQTPSDAKPLVIIVGSQKGLCGNFNALLAQFCRLRLEVATRTNTRIITVGKRAGEMLDAVYRNNVISSYDDFSIRSLDAVCRELSQHIMLETVPYSSITILSNEPKTFFVQKPHSTVLVPFTKVPSLNTGTLPVQGYMWKHKPEIVAGTIARQYLEARMEFVLFQSLLAEQAARFISMDNAMRNAGQILEDMQLDYNKLRQAKITKELTELSGSF